LRAPPPPAYHRLPLHDALPICAGEDRRPTDELHPVAEDGIAGPGEARVPLVRIVHPDQGARPPRRAAGHRRPLAEGHPRPARSQGVRNARAGDAPTDDNDFGRAHDALEPPLCARLRQERPSRVTPEGRLHGRCEDAYGRWSRWWILVARVYG